MLTPFVFTAVAIYYAISAWSQVLVWPAVTAPHYKYGWQVSIGLWALVIIMTLVLQYVDIKFMLYVLHPFHFILVRTFIFVILDPRDFCSRVSKRTRRMVLMILLWTAMLLPRGMDIAARRRVRSMM